MKNNELGVYLPTKKELLMLWLNNYDFGETLIDITEWVKFQAIDEFVQRLVMFKECNKDEHFRFTLSLNDNEVNMLRDFLLKRKAFVISHILKRESFSPNTHLYQLYLQYLPDKLNEVEKNILLDGYLHMLGDLQGSDYAATKRPSIEKKLNLR